MPDNTNKYSVDFYVYNWIKNYDNRICKLNPNYITFFNILVTLCIGKVLYDHKHWVLLLVLCIFRSILDISDGAIARKCNKTSSFGKYFDLFGDYLFFLVGLIVIFMSLKNPLYKKILLCIIPIYTIIFINTVNDDYKSLTTTYKLYHDNSIIFNPIVYFVFWFILNSL